MGVQKDLELCKFNLFVAKGHCEKANVDSAKKVLTQIKGDLAQIVKKLEERKKKAAEGLKKLNDTVKEVESCLNHMPYQGKDALDAINLATAAATNVVAVFDPAKG